LIETYYHYGLHTFDNDGLKHEYKHLINLLSIVQVTCQQELLPDLQISFMHSDNDDHEEYVQSGHSKCSVWYRYKVNVAAAE
jgi:hypothetical protein